MDLSTGLFGSSAAQLYDPYVRQLFSNNLQQDGYLTSSCFPKSPRLCLLGSAAPWNHWSWSLTTHLYKNMFTTCFIMHDLIVSI